MNKGKILFTYIHSNAHPDETDTLLGSHVRRGLRMCRTRRASSPAAPHERAGR